MNQEPAEELDFDFEQLECPRCKSRDVEVWRLPKPGSWYRATGRAVCNHCGAKFSLRVLDEEPAQDRPLTHRTA